MRSSFTAIRAALHSRIELLYQLPLVLFPLFLFRDHVLGRLIYLGNPDRLNSNLKVLLFQADAITQGHLGAWNPYEMLGYDSYALPYTFPNPLVLLCAAFGTESLFVTAGYVSVALLICAGLAAYAFIHDITQHARASLVGACCYQLAAISILKVSQNDMTFAIPLLIPIVMLVIHRLRAEPTSRSVLLLAVLAFVLLEFTFLQEVAYAAMLFTAYAAYRSWRVRAWTPVVTWCAALLVATIAALPRIAGIALAMKQYVRTVPGTDLSRFKAVYGFQNIKSRDFLRWFDTTVFGRFPSEAYNSINLTEGFLIYAGTTATLLSIAVLVRYRGKWLGLWRRVADEARFFPIAMVVLFLFALSRGGLNLLHVLFFRIDFTHQRILVAALLPWTVIVALAIQQLDSTDARAQRTARQFGYGLLAFVAAFALAWLVDCKAGDVGGFILLRLKDAIPTRPSALTGIYVSFALALLLWLGSRTYPEWPRFASISRAVLIALVPAQALVAADFQVNGPQVRQAAAPFFHGDLYAAPRTAFRRPSDQQRRRVHDMLEVPAYRSVVVCDSQVAGGFCAAHIADFWQLRLADGYYGLGVPARLAALPWERGLNLRSISFLRDSPLPWSTLSLLNVKYAVVVDPSFYDNTDPHLEMGASAQRTGVSAVIQNPLPVVPRFFFARAVTPVDGVKQAIDAMHLDDGMPDLESHSFVEGDIVAPALGDGQITLAEDSGDRLVLHVSASDRPRFLIANELFFSRWFAKVDGANALVYPTNGFMRGVLLPPGATSVIFEYRPLADLPWLATAVAAAAALLTTLIAAARRLCAIHAVRR